MNNTTLFTHWSRHTYSSAFIPFVRGDLLLGDFRKHVGLCTLWTPKDRYKHLRKKVAVIGNLYSLQGIGMIIRNALATPRMTTLIVTGKDHPDYSLQSGRKLIERDFKPKDLDLDDAHVQRFYDQVTIIDRRGAKVRKADLRSIAPRQSLERLFLPPPEPAAREVYPAARSGFLLRADTIQKGHLGLLREIRTFGHFTTPDSEGHKRQEIWQLTVVLAKECKTTNIPLYTDEQVQHYGEALWNGDEPSDMTYRYGHTMRYRYGDQISAVLAAFKKKPETFRTMISLWEPLQSLLRDDEPCLVTVHPRIVNGVMDMFAYIRTNDMFRGWPKNAAGLRHFQMRLAKEAGVEVGELTITSGSAHLYDRDWLAVDRMLEADQRRFMIFDPKGDFVLSRTNDGIQADHYQGGLLIQRLVAPNPAAMERAILPFVSDVSHALFVGREIERVWKE